MFDQGEIATSGPGNAGLVLFALGGEDIAIQTAVARGIGGRLREAGAEVAQAAHAVVDSPHRVMLMLTDALAGDQQEILRGAFSVAGAAVPLVGGCAGDDLKMEATFQFHGAEVLRDAVVVAAIGSTAPMGIGVRHGWRPVGDPMLVTRSDGNRVIELDGARAVDVYLDRLGAPAEARTDPEAFTRFALTHPLGLSRRSGEAHVRFIGDADPDSGALICIASVPEGNTVWVMEGDEQSVLDATDAACTDALAALDGSPPIGVLAFDCIARRGVLGEAGIEREIGRLAEHVAGAPVAGFYTYGEIARRGGSLGFHNQTMVVLAVQ